MTLKYPQKAFFALFVLFSFCVVCYGSPQLEELIPANTRVSVELLSPISTQTAQKGDKFSCKVLTPAQFAGAVVEGHVRSVKRSGKANKDSKLDLAFDRIITTEGRIGDFNATVVEVFDVQKVADDGRADNEGTVRSKSTTVKTSIKRAAVGALIGAIVGGAVAGGQGAAVGAAVGAGLGVTTTLVTKGPDLEFKTGTQFTVETNGPVRRRQPKPGESTVAAFPVSSKPPATPSLQTRLCVLKSYTIAIPDNWRDFSENDSTIVAPEGGYKSIGGRPEVTHGAMLGVTDVGTSDLKEANERFLTAMIKGNAYLNKREPSKDSSINERRAVTTMLSGTGREGTVEHVTIHTAVLANGKLFFVITVVPEAASGEYGDAFRNLVQSVKLNQNKLSL
ncbi:MAG TPA: hypothetical protein VGD61_20755 [Pyrinomonadaceae bacterium]